MVGRGGWGARRDQAGEAQVAGEEVRIQAAVAEKERVNKDGVGEIV